MQMIEHFIYGTRAKLKALRAALIPLPEDSVAGHFRNGLGLAVAIIIGLRLSRWLERRWGWE